MENEVLLTRLCLLLVSPVPTLMPLSSLLQAKLPDWIQKILRGIDCSAAIFYASPGQQIDLAGFRSGDLLFILLLIINHLPWHLILDTDEQDSCSQLIPLL